MCQLFWEHNKHNAFNTVRVSSALLEVPQLPLLAILLTCFSFRSATKLAQLLLRAYHDDTRL